MDWKVLYSNIWPLLIRQDQEIIDDCFRKEIKKSDRVEISVGFFSYKSLKELDRLVMEGNIKNVSLILGMYYFSGFPKSLHQLALEINEKWQRAGIGEIRVTHSFNYHGKLYCFFRDNQIFSAIFGSPNLSFLFPGEQVFPRQYEIALLIEDPKVLQSFLNHINDLHSNLVSKNIATLKKQQVFSGENTNSGKKRDFKIRSKKNF